MDIPWTEVIEVLVSGITNGSVYAVMSIGLALIYGTSRIFNFAYGSFYTLGGYIAWLLSVKLLSMSYPFIFISVIPIMYCIGYLTERLVIRSLRWKENWEDTTLMVTLGLGLFIDNLIRYAFGPKIKALPPIFDSAFSFGFISISQNDIFILGFSLFVVALCWIFITRTMYGKGMQAVALDGIGARIVGIPIKRVVGHTFAISTVLAGIAGIILASKFFITPLGGYQVLVKSFIIVTLGGLGSIKGALYSSFILGIIESLSGWLLGTMWVMAIWFIILITVLVIKPSGFFGKTA